MAEVDTYARRPFEWDDREAASNFKKHDVSFGLSRLCFDDNSAVDDPDDYDDEERFNRIGFANGNLLHVTYTIRGERIRIISARKATADEQETYARQAR